jgi:prephenate dehydrogenase
MTSQSTTALGTGQGLAQLSSSLQACTGQPRVALIGCHGRMGTLFMHRLAAGAQLCGVDLPLSAEKLHTACAQADIVLLCVPAAAMQECIALCVPHMQAGALLADIVSVKEEPLAHMEKAWQGACVGTHPLFGPQPAPDLALRVCLTPGARASQKHIDTLRQLFASMGAECFCSTAQEHDRAVSLIQSMNFITSLTYFAMLADKEELKPFITPSFLRRQEAARKLLTEDGALFTGLFEANPYAHESVRQYRSLLNIAAGGDIELLLHRAQRWLEQN